MSQGFAIATLVIFSVIFVEGNKMSKNHYPIYWTHVNTKEIIDNDRIFAKYKECLVKNHAVGCPAIVVDFKKVLPEMIKTNCAKCLPSHKQWFTTALEYVCHRRRDDYDEVRHEIDADGKYWESIQKILGTLDC